MAKLVNRKYSVFLAGYYDDFNAGRAIADDENNPNVTGTIVHTASHFGNSLNGEARLNPRYQKAYKERVDGDEFLDKGTQQRLFDPSTMNGEIIIKKAQIKNGFLEVDFNDGVNSKLDITKLETEFSNKDTVIKSIPKKKWDSSLKNIKNFEYKEGFFESKEMYDLLVSFYEFGFVVIKNVPTENNYIVKFANSIGSVRRTNFGEHFNVKSKSNPNDLAYTTLHLSPHTDNPYRNPVPCIQLLHCIENEVKGGFSTLVDLSLIHI